MDDTVGSSFFEYAPGAQEVTQAAPPSLTLSPAPGRRLISDLDNFNESIDDVDKGVHDYLWNHHRTLYLGTWVGTIMLGSLLFGLEIFYYVPLMRFLNNDARALAFPIFVFTWPGSLYTRYKQKMRHLFMEQIAQALGFTYQANGNINTVASVVLREGHGFQMEDVLAGTYCQNPLRMYNYTHTVGYGRYARTYSYTVFEIAFDKKLPDIILRPVSFFTENSKATNNVKLEGDFNTYFNLSAPQEYDMEIRVIFQPDLMAALIDKYRSYSIEIFQNKVYVLAPQFNKKADFLTAHDLMDHLFTKLLPSLEEVGSN